MIAQVRERQRSAANTNDHERDSAAFIAESPPYSPRTSPSLTRRHQRPARPAVAAAAAAGRKSYHHQRHVRRLRASKTAPSRSSTSSQPYPGFVLRKRNKHRGPLRWSVNESDRDVETCDGGDAFRRGASGDDGSGSQGSENHERGRGVTTIDTIVRQCGKSLIEPSAVSAPMEFLTSEAEYRRVWQVNFIFRCRSERLSGQTLKRYPWLRVNPAEASTKILRPICGFGPFQQSDTTRFMEWAGRRWRSN